MQDFGRRHFCLRLVTFSWERANKTKQADKNKNNSNLFLKIAKIFQYFSSTWHLNPQETANDILETNRIKNILEVMELLADLKRHINKVETKTKQISSEIENYQKNLDDIFTWTK